MADADRAAVLVLSRIDHLGAKRSSHHRELLDAMNLDLDLVQGSQPADPGWADGLRARWRTDPRAARACANDAGS